MRRAGACLVFVSALGGSRILAQNISGHAFEDRNGNGVQDPGEPSLPGVSMRLAGRQDAGPLVDTMVPTDATGAYVFSPGNGCYVLAPSDPAGWRLGSTRWDGFPPATTPGYVEPVGHPRFNKLDQGISHLKAGPFRITAMGDSIARNFNFCNYLSAFWYTTQVQSRLLCAFPSATFSLDQAAQLGETTDDLLVSETNNLNNVFQVFAAQPQLITISSIGNDLLDVDPPAAPTQAQVNKAVAEVLDARQNLQEILSSLTSQVPGADIVLNTLYDNLADQCTAAGSTDFHRAWLPIVDEILRDLAWGQTRRVSINEVAAEFAHEDQQRGCTGFEDRICHFLSLDSVHPDNPGYTIIREKLWEAAGGVNLGPKDALLRSSMPGTDYGFLRRVRRLYPTTWETRNGASVINPAAATTDQDGGAAAQVALGAGTEEFRLSGFPDWFDEIQIVRALAGVRYRTTGTVGDDFYRMEASVTSQFRPPPGFAYTPTNWNFYTPLVGGGGPNQPPENPDFPTEKLLAVPNVPAFRDVTATLTKNPTLALGAADYQWPAVTHADLSTTTIRLASAPVAGTVGNDSYQVVLDAAWVDLYGWEKPRPPEVSGGGGQALKVDRLQDGSLVVSFDALAGAQRYNLYVGRLATATSGGYDHGSGAPAGPLCGAPVQSAGPGRLFITLPAAMVPGLDSYLLVTAHVDDVESPAGFRTNGTEIDRSRSICR